MKISIVTVVYNREQTIDDAMESVFRQTHDDIDYIVVDGASSDGTVEKVRAFEARVRVAEKKGFSFRWMSEPDNGIYNAMNKGIRMATGDIVAILNSDDFYCGTDTLERVAKAFTDDPELQVVYGDNVYVREPDLDKIVRYASGGNYNWFTARCGIVPPHATFFTWRKNFERYGYYDESYRVSADCELELRFLEKYRLKSQYLPFSFMAMRLGGTSTSGLRSIVAMQSECLRACRSNGLYTNRFMQLLRLVIKVPQKIFKKDSKHCHLGRRARP